MFDIIFGFAPIALGALILVCTAINRFRERRRLEAEQAARAAAAAEKKRLAEQARREKQAQAEREQAAKQAASALKKQEAERKRQQREAKQAAAHAVKLARAAELAELAERRLQAEKELAQLRQEAAEQPAQRRETIPASPAQAAPAPAQEPAARPGMSLDQFAASIAPQPFAGEVVAFTGTLPTMGRAEAMQATQDRGGRACDHINTQCTLLVVGENAGNGQLDKADRWNVRKITWQEWFARAGISYRRRMVAAALAAERRA